MYDSYSTIDLLLADRETSPLPALSASTSSKPKASAGRLSIDPSPGPPPKITVAKSSQGKEGRVVGYGEWRRIEKAEVDKGRQLGKRAEKFVKVEEMLEVIDA